MRSSIILILCVFFTSSIMAKTLKDEKKNQHQHSKTIVYTIKHSKAIKNYYNLNRVHTDLVLSALWLFVITTLILGYGQ